MTVEEFCRAPGPISQKPWLLELYTSGCLEINVSEEGWRTRPAGSGVLLSPRTRFRERVPTVASPACTSMAMFFEMDERATLNRRFSRPFGYRFIEDPDGVLRRLVEPILHHYGGGEGEMLLAEGCFLQVLAALVMADERESRLIVRETPSAPPDLVTAIHRHLRQHLAQPLRRAVIARRVGLSESGLSHAYRRLTGRSLMATLQRMRVEAAEVYLLNNRLTLEQIAERTGFADAYHLSRTFKKLTGESPRTYRLRMRPQPGSI